MTKPSIAACALLLGGLTLRAQSIYNIGPNGISQPNSTTASAKPGSLVRVTLAGALGNARLTIGTAKLPIVRQDQNELTVRIPPQGPEGCYVPLHITRKGSLRPDSIPIAISRTGICQPPAYQFSNAWISKRTGILARVHSTEWSLDTGGQLSTVDIASAFFDGDATILQPGALLQFPPPGLCSSRSGTYVPGTATIDILLPMLTRDVNGVELDAGGFLNVDDGRYQTRIPLIIGRSAIFWKTVASTQAEFQSLKTQGNLTLRAPGGRDIPAFAANLPPPADFEWLNRPPTPILSVAHDVPVSWNATEPGVVILTAVAVNAAAARFAYCLCVAPAGANRYHLPGHLLRSMVTATGAGKEAAGVIYLIHAPVTIHPFQSPQLETAIGLSVRILTAKVAFRR